MLHGFLVAFGTVFVAELPDKTMVASLVLTTRTRRPVAVWAGVVAAFALHVTLAVTIGSLLRRLPDRPVQAGVGLLFLAGGVILLRSGDDEDEVADEVRVGTFFRVAALSAAAVGLAEFGDLTQLATAGIATRYGNPVAVAAGAWCALAAVAGLAVTAGSWIVRRVPLGLVRRVAAGLFLVLGLVALLSATLGG